MHVITRKRLNGFASLHTETRTALAKWYQLVKTTDFASFAELRAVFPSADQVGKLTVFNIGGNKVRLVAAIHYNRKRLYIRAALTHEEYDRGEWKGWAMPELDIDQAADAWSALAGNVFVPHTEEEYDRIVALLDSLVDEVGEDESHPPASLMEVLGVLVERYEAEHVPELIADRPSRL
ncbi:MAG TPA: type II toxin-antitoxin system HigB family toxin [Pyrinomonadaceae bacterium]|jgi:mRNA interferase HigB